MDESEGYQKNDCKTETSRTRYKIVTGNKYSCRWC